MSKKFAVKCTKRKKCEIFNANRYISIYINSFDQFFAFTDIFEVFNYLDLYA